MTEALVLRDSIHGHADWITAISIPACAGINTIATCSRDKTIIVWKIGYTDDSYCSPYRALKGHTHFVQDVAMSSDGQFCLSGSWDGTARLWEVVSGRTTKSFVGHTKEILSLAFSPDNRQIISGSRDKTLRLWNTLGECKCIMGGTVGHSEWVSSVYFSPSREHIVVSCGWDKLVKAWDLSRCCLKATLAGHTGYLNTVTTSPDGSLCASGGKEGCAVLWDLQEGKKLYQLDAGSVINILRFSPNRYWLSGATHSSIIIWDLGSKNVLCDIQISDHGTRSKKTMRHYCTCLQWSVDGSTLFAGYTDGRIRIFSIDRTSPQTLNTSEP